ncbi:MAG TPA: alpha amylase C-terminal domain-containing protein, partial [Dissulfurispiraceae bacterium]|nr:alpha amylase C-terminal domain-containing protein [Dissulfurispiraceae bacterium]
KKLLFMGGEFGQWREWNHDEGLDWHLLEEAPHQGVQRLVKDLNTVYHEEPALSKLDFSKEGFEWIDAADWEMSNISFIRKGGEEDDIILVVCNFTPLPRHNYVVGVPRDGFWKEIFNSDAECYGGSGHGNLGGVEASPVKWHGRDYSLTLTLPPLGVLFFKHIPKE